MKIIGIFFEVNRHKTYTRLTEVFEYSVRKNMPGTDTKLEIIQLQMPPSDNKRFQAQMIKQRKWTELALQQKEDYIIMDTDMLIVGDLSDAFQYDFDIAYTFRNKERKPLNGGMIFGRPNQKTNRFWGEWLFYCERAYNDKQLWSNFNSECKGFAQSALYHTIKHNKECKFKKLHCHEYNACDEEWEHADSSTKAYHIKGRMRKSLFHDLGIPSQKLYTLWRDYARECDSSNQKCG